MSAGRIWCEPGTKVRIKLSSGEPVHFVVSDSSGDAIIDRVAEGTTKRRGWHEVTAHAATVTPYEAYITYQATTELHRSDCDT
jgi:hypothetical protein